MRKLFFMVAIALTFIGCNKDSIEETKRLNQSKISQKHSKQELKKEVKQEPTKESQTTQILKLDYQNRLDLQKAKHQKEQELAKLQAQKEMQIAQINATKEQKLKELEAQIVKTKSEAQKRQKELEANRSITVAKIESSTAIETTKSKTTLYRNIAIIAAIIVVLWLIFYYLNKASKRRHEAHLKEQELNHKAYMEETKLKHQNISKMLEIIGDEKSDKEIKKEMTKLLSYNKNSILEHKKN